MFRIARRALAMLAGVGLVALTLLACVQPQPPSIQGPMGEEVRLEAWTATLTSSSTALKGTATLSPGVTYRESLASLSLSGATPGAVHGWFVQLGDCGDDRGILASLQAYPPITVDAGGQGKATVTLPFTVPTSGHFFVSVRQGDSDRAAVVACGNLTKVGSAVGPTVAAAPAP
jgi:hypothetical protein